MNLNLGDLIEIDQRIGVVFNFFEDKKGLIISLLDTNGFKQEYYFFPFVVISKLETTLKSIES